MSDFLPPLRAAIAPAIAVPVSGIPGASGTASAPLREHGRFDYSPITQRAHYRWPNGAGLAVYVGFNIEHFAFGEGLGATLTGPSPQPDVLNYSWREYGNRVGVWRCLELFDRLSLPLGALINAALFDHCPEVIDACVARGDELIAHGYSNAERQGAWPEAQERAMLAHCRDRIAARTGVMPAGWLSPWIAESPFTPDLLTEEGYAYTLNWCHDDQPTKMRTRSGRALWSIPYPQECNDIPMIVVRQMDGADFARMIVDQFDEMLVQAREQPLVMGIALHPYLVGQPYRLRHLRTALEHIARVRDTDGLWFATPGAIHAHVAGLALAEEAA